MGHRHDRATGRWRGGGGWGQCWLPELGQEGKLGHSWHRLQQPQNCWLHTFLSNKHFLKILKIALCLMLWMEGGKHSSLGSGSYKTNSLCSQNSRVQGLPAFFSSSYLSLQRVGNLSNSGVEGTEPSDMAQEEDSLQWHFSSMTLMVLAPLVPTSMYQGQAHHLMIITHGAGCEAQVQQLKA